MSRRTRHFDQYYIHAHSKAASAQMTYDRIHASNPMMNVKKVTRIAARLAELHSKRKGI